MAGESFSDIVELGAGDGEFAQSRIGITDESKIVDVSNFTNLAEKAKEAGDEWTKGTNYFMAMHTAESSATSAETSTATQESTQGSTIGLLLSTSVGLQKLNMKFNVIKGIVEAVAAKAVTIAQDIAGAARGR